MAGASEDLILSVDVALLHQLVPPLLRDEDTRIEAATCLARRLQSQVDSQSDAAAVIRLMCAHCASDDFLLELLLELLVSVEHKEPIIHSIALSAVDATEQQVQAVLDAYRQLLVQDRAFLVPIVGSISELQLTPAQRESFLSLIEGSLAVVDDSDVPTMVSALLQLSTAANAVKIIRSVRAEAAHVTISIASLLASPLVATIRARAPSARAYIAELSRTPPLTSMDVLTIASLQQVPSMRRAAAGALFAAISMNPPAIDILRSTLSSPLGNEPANIHLLYVTLQQPFSLPQGAGSSSRRSAPARLHHLSPSLRLATSVAVAQALICHHEDLRKQVVSALLTACATRALGECSVVKPVAVDADDITALPDGSNAAASKSGARGSRSGVMVNCAQIAARTLLQIAETDAGSLQECNDQMCQFFAQHASVCSGPVLHLIAATMARIIQHGSKHVHLQANRGGVEMSHGVAGSSSQRGREVDSDDEGGMLLGADAGRLGAYSAALLLIQKLFFSMRPELQRGALILAGHVLRAGPVPQMDAQMMLRNALRLPFDPTWVFAREMYLFHLNALPSLSVDSRDMLLDDHLLPALLRAGLVRQTHCAGERCDRGDTGEPGFILSIHECVKKVLSGGWSEAQDDTDRSGGHVRTDGYTKAQVSARVRIRETFVHSVVLLEEFLLYQLVKTSVGRGDRAEEQGRCGGGEKASMQACNWQVEMPSDLQKDFNSVETPTVEDVHDALRIGWACYLNFAAGVVACCAVSPVALSSSSNTAMARDSAECQISPVILGRLVQAMQCRQHLQDVIIPFLVRSQKALARLSSCIETREMAPSAPNASDASKRSADIEGDASERDGRRSHWSNDVNGDLSNGAYPDCAAKKNVRSASAAAPAMRNVMSSLSPAILALSDVCSGNWEVEVPSFLLCGTITALEPQGLATQKALLEMLRLLNGGFCSSAQVASPPSTPDTTLTTADNADDVNGSSSCSIPACGSRDVTIDTTFLDNGQEDSKGSCCEIGSGIMCRWLQDAGLNLSPLSVATFASRAACITTCDVGSGSGKGKEAMPPDCDGSGVRGQDGNGVVGVMPKSQIGSTQKLHTGVWEIFQSRAGGCDLVTWLGMHLAPLMVTAHKLRIGEDADDSAQESVFENDIFDDGAAKNADPEHSVLPPDLPSACSEEEDEWSPNLKRSKKSVKGSKARNKAESASSKDREADQMRKATDLKLSVSLRLLAEIYVSLLLLVQFCVRHCEQGQGLRAVSSDKIAQIGGTLCAAIRLGKQLFDGTVADHGTATDSRPAAVEGECVWAEVYQELESLTEELEDANIASLHVSLLSTVAQLAPAHSLPSPVPVSAASASSSATRFVMAQDMRQRLADLAERCVRLVFPLSTSFSTTHLSRDLALAPFVTHSAWVSRGNGCREGGLRFVYGGSELSRTSSTRANVGAYTELMGMAIGVLPAGRAFALAESFLRVATRPDTVEKDECGSHGSRREKVIASKRKDKARGREKTKCVQGKVDGNPCTAERRPIFAAGVIGELVCVEDFSSVSVDTVDDMVTPLIGLINSLFRSSFDFESEVHCKHVLLHLCCCLSLGISMLNASRSRNSLLNHAGFHAPLQRASVRMITQLRRNLPGLMTESSRLLSSSDVRKGVLRDLMLQVQALVRAHAMWTDFVTGSTGGGDSWRTMVGHKRKMADAAPKAELERDVLSRLIVDLADVYLISLQDHMLDAADGISDQDGGTNVVDGDDDATEDGRCGWQSIALHKLTITELLWGNPVGNEMLEGMKDFDGVNGLMGTSSSNSETETDSDLEGIEGFYGVKKHPRGAMSKATT